MADFLSTSFRINSLKLIFGVALLSWSLSSSAQSTRMELDSLKQSFLDYRGQAVEEFNDYVGKAFDEYFSYLELAKAEFEAYDYRIKQTWGGYAAAESGPAVWVEYGPDNQDRSIVDFENGDVTVEVIVPDDVTDEAEIDSIVAAAVGRLLSSRGSTCPYPSAVDKSEPLTVEPVMDGLIDMSSYKIDDAEPAREPESALPPSPVVKSGTLDLGGKTPPVPVPGQKSGNMARKRLEGKALKKKQEAKAIAEQAPRTVAKIVGNDGKQRKVVRVKMEMVTDNLAKNAALYKDIVAEFSQKFNVEQPLIYAVMEQESRFNPEAKSWVPAYGLMQLVATSGGFDAYRFVYGKEWVPTQSYLFNPRNNIELGTAYLRILMNQFSMVADEACRRLCVIAGYNTGAGNVSRAFTGKTNIKSAIPMINNHNYNSLFDHLTTRLSTEEARNYVSGVSRRREKYIKR